MQSEPQEQNLNTDEINKLVTMNMPAFVETMKKVTTVTFNRVAMKVHLFKDSVTLEINNQATALDTRYIRIDDLNFFKYFFLVVKVILNTQKVRDELVKNVQNESRLPLSNEALKLLGQSLVNFEMFKDQSMAEAYAQFVLPKFYELYEGVAINLKDITGRGTLSSPRKVFESIAQLNERMLKIML